MPMHRPGRIFDCVLYNGEREALQIRLQEIGNVVDQVILVEGTCTFSGIPRELAWNPNDICFQHFVSKIRHVVVNDYPDTDNPWAREKWQRNAILRGIPDAEEDDIIVISDVDEVPRASVLLEIVGNSGDYRVFGLRMDLFYFFVNYQNIGGPEIDMTTSVAARRSELDRISPNELRYKVRRGDEKALIYKDAGWHFSYLSNERGIRTKIASFSHQELNNPEFLESIDIGAIIRRRGDLLDRPGYEWDIVDSDGLPCWLRDNRRYLSHLFYPRCKLESLLGKAKANLTFSVSDLRRRKAPVVFCPYAHAYEEEVIRNKFRLDSRKGRRLPFYLWHDTRLLGPERAFEHCWDQFPGRDIIIVHSDMSPMPDDYSNEWYDSLIYYRDTLAQAGMVACNLLLPCEQGAPRSVQFAGGTYVNNRLNWLHGKIGEDGIPSNLLERARAVHWVTFGGVLIRREVIRACGKFDNRYKWADVMDVDYSFEARLRGFRLYQVSAYLQHEAPGITKSMMAEDASMRANPPRNYEALRQKWRLFADVIEWVPE